MRPYIRVVVTLFMSAFLQCRTWGNESGRCEQLMAQSTGVQDPGRDEARKRSSLAEGDDRIPRLIQALTHNEDSARSALLKYGDAAIPYLLSALKGCQEGELWILTGVLAAIPSKKATEALCSLYRTSNRRLSFAAAYRLAPPEYGWPEKYVFPECRRGAKDVYLDMLRKRVCLNSAAEACAQFGWIEVLPILHDIWERPSKDLFTSFIPPVILPMRKLEGQTGALKVMQAKARIAESGFVLNVPVLFPAPQRLATEMARWQIQFSEDKEAAVLAGIFLTGWQSKDGVGDVNAIGRDILQRSPKDVSMRILLRWRSALEQDPDSSDAYEKKRIQELMEICGTKAGPVQWMLYRISLPWRLLLTLGIPFLGLSVLAMRQVVCLLRVQHGKPRSALTVAPEKSPAWLIAERAADKAMLVCFAGPVFVRIIVMVALVCLDWERLGSLGLLLLYLYTDFIVSYAAICLPSLGYARTQRNRAAQLKGAIEHRDVPDA